MKSKSATIHSLASNCTLHVCRHFTCGISQLFHSSVFNMWRKNSCCTLVHSEHILNADSCNICDIRMGEWLQMTCSYHWSRKLQLETSVWGLSCLSWFLSSANGLAKLFVAVVILCCSVQISKKEMLARFLRMVRKLWSGSCCPKETSLSSCRMQPTSISPLLKRIWWKCSWDRRCSNFPGQIFELLVCQGWLVDPSFTVRWLWHRFCKSRWNLHVSPAGWWRHTKRKWSLCDWGTLHLTMRWTFCEISRGNLQPTYEAGGKCPESSPIASNCSTAKYSIWWKFFISFPLSLKRSTYNQEPRQNQ